MANQSILLTLQTGPDDALHMVVQKVVKWVPDDEVSVSFLTSFRYAD